MIKQTYNINAPVESVWQALVDPKIIQQWSGDKAEMSDRVDFKFKLWGGDIWGTNTKVATNQLLEQDWYGGDWPKPSRVAIKLSQTDGVTTVELMHEDVPENEEQNFADGWRDYYFGPMKELLES